MKRDSHKIGTAVGLAWTRVGGSILLIETIWTKAKHYKLNLTGNVKEVMRESVETTIGYIHTHFTPPEDNGWQQMVVNIHFPEAAVPKDGPSAGIPIFVALISAFYNTRVK